MIYGLYMSAAGIRADVSRINTITNNLANVETEGFKRDMAIFQQRKTAAQENIGKREMTNRMLEVLGGDVNLARTQMDLTQGDTETTENDLDFAIVGNGFFGVQQGKNISLTRDGRFTIDKQGLLVHSTTGEWVLSRERQPIMVHREVSLQVSGDGTITQNGEVMGKIGVWTVPDTAMLNKRGGGKYGFDDLGKSMSLADGKVNNRVLERSNVDSAIELTQLIQAQRSLEANANLIRCQDETLDRLVNTVAKIS